MFHIFSICAHWFCITKRFSSSYWFIADLSIFPHMLYLTKFFLSSTDWFDLTGLWLFYLSIYIQATINLFFLITFGFKIGVVNFYSSIHDVSLHWAYYFLLIPIYHFPAARPFFAKWSNYLQKFVSNLRLCLLRLWNF